ncbi:glycosyltransferase [Nocardioides daeguensis]|uniref:Glycosyltransferase n=1 Tax=Nocardioides daeguensis TaxID=908359 RepID=A0ABP6V8E2_9ACTN|nr:glycosyltransferase family 4 protein [Nocardioides daeguensis]MBV6726177.1 glycosyltransferase family 4 protein [Nocardioides daeguensis]MCR1772020.1 glycosyltransferase family 4 protein [Nocardioides daeguensis]
MLKAQGHEVHVVGIAWSDEEGAEFDRLNFVNSVTSVRGSRWAAVVRVAAAVFTQRSLQQAYTSSPRFRRVLRRELAELSPDIVYFNVVRSAQFLSLVGAETATMVDLDERRSRFYELSSRTSTSFVARALGRIEARRMRRAERRAEGQAGAVLYSSPVDVEDPGRDILVRSPKSAGDVRPRDSTPGRIVFVGRQCYRPNVEAVTWFADQVLPPLAREFPGVELVVVGERPSRAVKALSARPGIVVTGRVPSIAEEYSRAQIAIVPVRSATGVQLKFIEALECGVPTVVTPVVAVGAGVEDGEHTIVADSAEEWRDAIRRLLVDNDLALAMAGRASTWTVANYSDMAVSRALAEGVAQAMRKADVARRL